MKLILFILGVILASTNAAGPFTVGENHFCLDGFKHYVTYNVSATTQPVYDVEELNGFESLECDLDGTQLQIQFSSKIHAHSAARKLSGAFLSGISNKTCPMKFDPSKGFLLRKIVGSDVDGD